MTDESGAERRPATGDPDLEAIRETVEQLLAAEAERRAAVEAELDAVEADREARFDRTRDVMANERELLASLERLLAAERERIAALESASEHLRTDQAVRNREAALRRLRQHNTDLQTFHDALSAALDAVAANLDTLEQDPTDALSHDAEPHLREARDAIERHNETVESLGKNLRILAQYMR